MFIFRLVPSSGDFFQQVKPQRLPQRLPEFPPPLPGFLRSLCLESIRLSQISV
jgi:hypothetical protein